jgi:hypothetical protein
MCNYDEIYSNPSLTKEVKDEIVSLLKLMEEFDSISTKPVTFDKEKIRKMKKQLADKRKELASKASFDPAILKTKITL